MKNIIIILTLSFCVHLAKAQDEEVHLKLRHIGGINGIDALAGINKYGYQFSLGITQFENERLMGRIILNSEFGKIGLSSYNTSTIAVGLDHTIYKIKDKLFFNLGYGGYAGFETSSNEVLDKKTDTFDYGVYAEVNTEFYVFNRLALVVEFKEMWDNGSLFGQFRYYAHGGFRFYL